ncbi:MAG: tyrosine-type recombinase/integrase [Desulfurivibrio sp.]|nr:tyrosine-type recombinase/integrase [Desulfurivibrio sp.]
MSHFGDKTHPRELDSREIELFLSHLATEGRVAASTQRQALNALVFLYHDVLEIPLDDKIAPARSKRHHNPPTVLTQAETQQLLAAMEGKHALMAKLLYGSGLRLMECLRLRLKDVDFGQNLIFVRGAKGGKDRTTVLPRNLRDQLQNQVRAVEVLHHQDLEAGFGEVYIRDIHVLQSPLDRLAD